MNLNIHTIQSASQREQVFRPVVHKQYSRSVTFHCSFRTPGFHTSLSNV